MKKIFFLLILFFFNKETISFAEITDCNEFKKFSVEYIKCKGNLVKDKTISTTQNIIKDTKDYQNKEWSEEKKKINKTKYKIKKAKEKVLNK